MPLTMTQMNSKDQSKYLSESLRVAGKGSECDSLCRTRHRASSPRPSPRERISDIFPRHSRFQYLRRCLRDCCYHFPRVSPTLALLVLFFHVSLYVFQLLFLLQSHRNPHVAQCIWGSTNRWKEPCLKMASNTQCGTRHHTSRTGGASKYHPHSHKFGKQLRRSPPLRKDSSVSSQLRSHASSSYYVPSRRPHAVIYRRPLSSSLFSSSSSSS
mmetsp:Transcript_1230/g.1878  ORF Transcript_1230/g.1878 Transcript_1230/m.1878 type:complete len:213 (-) Transcript_1230:420-1058(-)